MRRLSIILAMLAVAGCGKKNVKTDVLDEVAQPAKRVAAYVPAVKAVPVVKDAVGGFADILFGYDQYTLSNEAFEQLADLAVALIIDKGSTVVLSGHACQLGTDEYNLALSEHRARGVRYYLVKYGIDASRISVVAYGEALPVVALPDTELGHDLVEYLNLNRRVEIEVR